MKQKEKTITISEETFDKIQDLMKPKEYQIRIKKVEAIQVSETNRISLQRFVGYKGFLRLGGLKFEKDRMLVFVGNYIVKTKGVVGRDFKVFTEKEFHDIYEKIK